MSTDKTAKPHIPIKDYYTVADVAILLRTSETRARQFAKRKDDPLPFRQLNGHRRGMFIACTDLRSWVERNSILVRSERARAIERGDVFFTTKKFRFRG